MAELFSLLMPVYRGDQPDHLRRAFTSSVVDQTRRPSQVVLIQDGPLTSELSREVDRLVASSPVPVLHHVLEENVGLARALNIGLELCVHDVIARMDADDISLPDRFSAQVPLVESGLDVVGTGMYEFLDDVGSIVGQRVPRVGADDIARYARFHDPFSHPTVVYRKSAVVAAGGYQPLGRMEDYWLFARMIHRGARVGNIPDPLVMYRVGAGAYARRGGIEQWLSEVELQRAFRSIRFTSRIEFARNITVRGVYRFVPETIRRRAYRLLIAGRPAKAQSSDD